MKQLIRVQRKRIAGWKMPANTIYVGRPTKWGNPNRIIDGNYKLAVGMYDAMLAVMKVKVPDMYQFFLDPLRGKNLACWCPLGQPCHADLLLKVANN